MSLVWFLPNGLIVPLISTGPTLSTRVVSLISACFGCSDDNPVIVPSVCTIPKSTVGDTERSVKRTAAFEITMVPIEIFGSDELVDGVAFVFAAAVSAASVFFALPGFGFFAGVAAAAGAFVFPMRIATITLIVRLLSIITRADAPSIKTSL